MVSAGLLEKQEMYHFPNGSWENKLLLQFLDSRALSTLNAN